MSPRILFMLPFSETYYVDEHHGAIESRDGAARPSLDSTNGWFTRCAVGVLRHILT